MQNYFSGEEPRMLMFDDGNYTLGIYGFKDGYVYVMDPHDKSRVFCNSKTEFELDDPSCGEAEFVEESYADMPSEEDYKCLYYTPVEKFDDRNYCILQCTNPDLNPSLFDYEEDLESYISAGGYKFTEKRPRNCPLKDPKHSQNKYLK